MQSPVQKGVVALAVLTISLTIVGCASTGGIAPDIAKRLSQELIVRDGVDILAGFVLTPNALAAAAVSAEARRLMVVMNACSFVVDG